MIERRNFLKGLLIGAASGEALIKLASPAETSALVVNQPAIVGQPPPMTNPVFPPGKALLANPPEVYARTGPDTYEVIGYLTDINPLPLERSSFDTFGWEGTGRSYGQHIEPLKRVLEFSFEGFMS